MSNYEISDKDIETALRYLKYHDPENATRERAVALLQDLQAGFHGMAHDNPQLLVELQKEINRNRQLPKIDDQTT
jgi:hypothetical protein